jgi:peptidoglycan glycosyltransferase
VDHRIRRLGIALLVLFLALFAQLTWLQAIDASHLANHPGNTRNAVRDFGRLRGSIVTADGRTVAESVPNPDRGSKFEHLRRYPGGQLYGHLTGFFSFTYGSTGLERRYNEVLAGREGALVLSRDKLEELLTDRVVVSDLELTVIDGVQREAARALGRRRGSVVALDPRSGAVLASVSFPSFDPSAVSGLDQEEAQANYRALEAAPAKPLLARAYREVFPPGSTFKTVTAAVGLGTETAGPDTLYPELRELPLPLTTRPLRNFGGSLCGGTLFDAFVRSCNTSFAQLGLDLGAERLHAGAVAFGFGDRPPLDIEPRPAPSVFPEVAFFDRNTPAIAQSAIGQGDVRATPLEMALVAAGVANGGVIMRPHLVATVRDRNGAVVRSADTGAWRRPMDEATAAELTAMMIDVVRRGTGGRAAVAGVQVAAKTGTAQTTATAAEAGDSGGLRAHAWTIAFAPAEAPTVAVAVIVENQPEVREATGGRIAAPVAGRVIKAALDAQAGRDVP